MRVIATNISAPKTVTWRGKNILTGIYKQPISDLIHLGIEDVRNDAVIDRKHHGGEYKACYLFGANYYSDWKAKYPNLEWNWGMFGENLTMEYLNEEELKVGAIYSIGSALVQISEPRQPCFKLGIRFNDQNVMAQFIQYGHPGTYVRVLKEGKVGTGDIMELIEAGPNSLSISQYNTLLNQRKKDRSLVELALENPEIRPSKREFFEKYLQKNP